MPRSQTEITEYTLLALQKTKWGHSEWPEHRHDGRKRGRYHACHAEMQALAFLDEENDSSHSAPGKGLHSPDATLLVTSKPCEVCDNNLKNFCQGRHMILRVVYPQYHDNESDAYPYRRVRIYGYDQ